MSEWVIFSIVLHGPREGKCAHVSRVYIPSVRDPEELDFARGDLEVSL